MPRILVVDDDKAVQEMLADTLREHGYEVHTCQDGKQVLPELGRGRCDLLILDVLIPHMNGFVLIEQIRNRPDLEDLPVIMISGIYRSRNHRTEMTTRFKVVEYLDKPLPMERLMELVERSAGPPSPVPAEADAAASEAESGEWAAPEDIVDADDLTLTKQHSPVPLTSEREPASHDKPNRAATEAKKKTGKTRPKAKAKPDTQPTTTPVPDQLVDAAARQEKKAVETEARRSFQTSAFVLQGSLAKMPVVAVMGRLCRQHKSGALLLRCSKVKKIVYVKSGNPVLVKSNLVSECLGQILLRERLINKQECEASIETMKKTGKRQGEILVEMGCLTKKNLKFALELQLETKLFDTFLWDSGEYRFNTSTKVEAEGAGGRRAGAAIVAEGIRRTFDETRLRSLMLPVIDVALDFGGDISGDLEAMRLDAREKKAVAAIVPGRTTRELLDSMPVDYPDALRIIYTLIVLELLRPAV